MTNRNDWLTVAAIGLIAMCIVTFDHEALGHGSACLLLHGHILLLSSSIFHCDVRSGWIDPAGPAGNLVMGTLALVCLGFVPARLLGVRLFLVIVTAFAYFWECAYLMDAMATRHGDLYFFAQFLWGDLAVWQRVAGAACGLALFILASRLTSRALLKLWSDAAQARRVARIVWLSATLGEAAAALAYRGQGWGDFRDAVLEIGAASILLLFIPRGNPSGSAEPSPVLARNYAVVALAIVIYGAFIVTLGRGVVV